MEFLEQNIVELVLYINNLIPAVGSNVIPFVILLGVLVFFHELGHFIVGKLCGVRVDEFSIGYPPKLFGKKIGETEYMISLLPFGGYVKLAGQDDFGKAEINLNDKRMYYSKPAWQRFLIVLAGPLANFIIGWFLFTLIFYKGVNVSYNPKTPGKIGIVYENSAAAESGLKNGDEILQINDIKIKSWNDLLELSINPQSKIYEAKIKRNNKIFVTKIQPKKVDKRYIFGISQYMSTEIGSIIDEDNKSVLLPGDEIEKINNVPVDLWYNIDELLFFNKTDVAKIVLKRNNELLNMNVKLAKQKLKNVGIFDVEFKTVRNKSFYNSNELFRINDADIEKAGFKIGDKIIKINLLKESKVNNKVDEFKIIQEIKINSGYELIKILSKLPEKWIMFEVNRNNKVEHIKFQLKKGNLDFGYLNIMPKEYLEYYSLKNGFLKSLEKTKHLIVQTFQVIGKIFKNEMQAKDVLGGPITIWKISVLSAEAGYEQFLLLMAVISINLGFINLLPIPVIDGGHLVIYTYEMISGKMPSEKVLNVIQQLGLAFILFLMIFTIYIDISKLF